MRLAKGLFPVCAALLLPVPALADHHQEEAPKITVVERDENGRATRININGREMYLCTPQMQDSCINPREAGFDFGNVPLDDWPDEEEPQAEELPQEEAGAVVPPGKRG